MLLRHKVPTIFNIYMLDVICCALGCVILLWQVAHQEAEKQTDDAKKQSAAAVSEREKFEKAQKGLLSASSDVIVLRGELTEQQKKYELLTLALALTEKEREEARKLASLRQESADKVGADLALSKEQLKKLESDLTKLLAEHKKTSAELTGKEKLNLDLLAQIAIFKKDITAKQGALDLATKQAQEQAALLKLSDEEARKLKSLLKVLRDDNTDVQAKIKLTELQLKMREQDLEKSKKELLAIAGAKDKLAKDLALGGQELIDAKTLIAALARDRDLWKEKGVASNAALGTLRLEKDKLSQRVVALQAEVEQRFAGIPLTGENVIFLIDISGSMAMKDEDANDPDKWPFLCDTLMKLMKSIPTLKRFQVVLFSDKTSYLFGSRDSWFKYEGPKTAEMTRDALRKVKVEGGTNMQAGFEEAFRYRKLKLDTIYIFSDGLPNIGEGVPAGVRNPNDRSLHMSKFVRDKLKTDWNRPTPGLTDVRINAVGFFFESPDVGAFLWALAREHRGSFVGLR